VSRLATTRSTPSALSLTTGTSNTLEAVPRIEPTQAFRTLGVHLAASGNQVKQAAILHSHSEAYRDSIQSASLTPTEAYWSYMMFLRPRLNYPLPCCSLTQQQYRHIQAAALAALLPKLHLNCHIPRVVLFGPSWYGGLEIPELYTDQGIGQLKLLFGHTKLHDQVGQQILCILSELQLFIGSSSPVLSLPFKVYGQWVGEYWLVSIWRHMSQIGFTLEVENAWRPSLSCQHDIAIMDAAMQYNFTAQQLKQINFCRMYLQVIMLSDIVDASGTRILSSAFHGTIDVTRSSKLHWPAWQCPNSWTSWKQLLTHLSTRGRLHQELGPWIAPTHQEWQWFQDSSQDVVYHCSLPSTWEFYSRSSSVRVTRCSRMLYSSPQPCAVPTSLPLLFPATVVQLPQHGIRALPSASTLVTSCGTMAQQMWVSHQVPPELSDTLVFFQRLIGPAPPSAFDCSEVVAALQEDKELLGCSDGSHVASEGQCYHGWVLASETRKTIVEGFGPGHGHPDLLSSYRAELGGLLALIYLVYRISAYHANHSGSLRLHCDNKLALNQATKAAPLGITPYFSSDYDLLELIRRQWESGLKVNTLEISGSINMNSMIRQTI